jgi:hypothetical protein
MPVICKSVGSPLGCAASRVQIRYRSRPTRADTQQHSAAPNGRSGRRAQRPPWSDAVHQLLRTPSPGSSVSGMGRAIPPTSRRATTRATAGGAWQRRMRLRRGPPTVPRAVGTSSRSTGWHSAGRGAALGRLWAVEDHPTTRSDADQRMMFALVSAVSGALIRPRPWSPRRSCRSAR